MCCLICVRDLLHVIAGHRFFAAYPIEWYLREQSDFNNIIITSNLEASNSIVSSIIFFLWNPFQRGVWLCKISINVNLWGLCGSFRVLNCAGGTSQQREIICSTRVHQNIPFTSVETPKRLHFLKSSVHSINTKFSIYKRYRREQELKSNHPTFY